MRLLRGSCFPSSFLFCFFTFSFLIFSFFLPVIHSYLPFRCCPLLLYECAFLLAFPLFSFLIAFFIHSLFGSSHIFPLPLTFFHSTFLSFVLYFSFAVSLLPSFIPSNDHSFFRSWTHFPLSPFIFISVNQLHSSVFLCFVHKRKERCTVWRVNFVETCHTHITQLYTNTRLSVLSDFHPTICYANIYTRTLIETSSTLACRNRLRNFGLPFTPPPSPLPSSDTLCVGGVS